MPAARSFHVSHQWLLELKDRGHLRAATIYFCLPDSEPVWSGHYLGCHEQIAAKQAMGWFLREMRPSGFEVIIPRRISPAETYRIHLASVLPLERIPILEGNEGTSSANGPFSRLSGRLSVVD